MVGAGGEESNSGGTENYENYESKLLVFLPFSGNFVTSDPGDVKNKADKFQFRNKK